MSFINTYGRSDDVNFGTGERSVNRARAAGLSDLQIIQIGQREGISWGPNAQRSLLEGAQREQNDTISGLESRLNQQASQFQQQMQQVQDQMRQQQAAYEQQIQLMENAQRAYVPQAEAVAEETQDSQPQQASAGGRRLSSLAIIEGLGTNANPLSGLQLA